jgi:hypothetical protein
MPKMKSTPFITLFATPFFIIIPTILDSSASSIIFFAIGFFVFLSTCNIHKIFGKKKQKNLYNSKIISYIALKQDDMGLLDYFRDKKTVDKGVEYERNLAEEEFYFVRDAIYSSKIGDNFTVAQKHPILTTALSFISQIFAQAEFYIKDSKGQRVDKHWMLDLLDKPSFKMTRTDFLESLFFNRIAGGTVIAHMHSSSTGFKPNKIDILDITRVRFPGLTASELKKGKLEHLKIKYMTSAKRYKIIPITELVFVRDLPLVPTNSVSGQEAHLDQESGLYNSRYLFVSKSRIDGIRQTLKNTVISLEAKETILKTNGRELIKSNKSEGSAPLSDSEKLEAENKLNHGKGLLRGQSRSWITKFDVEWQSLHIALRDLGLDESVKTDGNIIYTCLHIPKDIMSLDLKKSSYQNQKESMVAFIQNEMETMLQDFTQSMSLELDNGEKLIGTYDEMAVMQYIKLQHFDSLIKQATALKTMQAAGVSWEDAIELCGFDKGLKKDENSTETNEAGEANQQEDSGAKSKDS